MQWCVCELFLYVHMWTMCMSGAGRSCRTVPGPFYSELPEAVGHHVHAGHWAHVLFKSSEHSYPLIHFSRPLLGTALGSRFSLCVNSLWYSKHGQVPGFPSMRLLLKEAPKQRSRTLCCSFFGKENLLFCLY